MQGTGGHSSIPPRETAVGVVAAAITRLERHPMPARIDGATAAMFEHVAPALPFTQRLVLANRWLFDPLLRRVLARTPATDATIRTTTAPTVIEGSPKDNVLPARARAVVNFRILPGDDAAAVLGHVRQVVHDRRVSMQLAGAASEPSPVASDTSAAFRAVARSVHEVAPDALVAPGLVIAATDARHYAAIARDVYRFVPITVTPADLERVHGTNERLSVRDFGVVIRFMAQLIRNAQPAR